MISVTCDAMFEGGPLSVLNDLLNERQRILGESAKDAVVATGIDALVSLRALTKTAPKNARSSEYSFVRDYEKAPYVTFKGRRAHDPYGQGLGRRWKFTHLPGTDDERTYIKYPYTGRHRGRYVRSKRGYQMTGGDKKAEWNEVLRFMGLRPIKRRGLAKRVLGALANEISTRPGRNFELQLQEYARGNLSHPPRGLGRIMYGAGGGVDAKDVTLHIEDRLDYAALALNGGPSAVDLALKKAGNKIAGRLSKVAEAKLGEKVPTPFPEVRQRRVA